MAIHAKKIHPIRRFSFLAGAALVMLVIQPFLWNWVEVMAVRLQDKRTESQQYEIVRKQLQITQDTSKDRQGLLSQLDAIFPGVDMTSVAVERIEELAGRNGLVVEVKSIVEREGSLAGKPLPGIQPLKVTIEVLGNVNQLLQYIEALEHAPELVAIENWRIQSFGDASSEVPTIRNRLVAEVVFYLHKPPDG